MAEAREDDLSHEDLLGVIEGLTQALQIAHGTADRSTYRLHTPLTIRLRQLRQAGDLSREAFAAGYGLDPEALQAWEEGRVDLGPAEQGLVKLILDDPDRARAVLAPPAIAAE